MEAKNVNSNTEAPGNLITTTVENVYKAFSSGDAAKKISGLVASDLEWWFHGAQNCHHMMKILTGKSSPSDFKFEPRSIDAIDERVIVEGWEGAQVYWVHVWTLKDGAITQFREYFNTWLTVKDLRRPLACLSATTLWQSHPRDLAERSLPGLMLPISWWLW